ncbi:aminoglycoside phosphotransferase family protein [Vibrio tubiashii]|uniref:aminoglycoside phosphotransferase family protein n=1 Tax=Vibrio tubiashii TaxID=29498 RepID=UPI001EFD52BE|nr:aminoglycoside phosphotransferase family protein [Vibrio tubiashii]MCG9575798.1 aminoglycoside phosphotransferase family protein [Vibrio tubiashii]
MKYNYQPLVSELGYATLHSLDVLQTLWGGYGELVRLYVDNTSVIVKHVLLPKPKHHPKGWNTDVSHQRKLRSYQVELNWYQFAAKRCHAKVPATIMVKQHEQELLLVMEDLQQVGFTEVVTTPNQHHLSACLGWLANFHAQHIGHQGEGLWEVGTYWHLATRADELQALSDVGLKARAEQIDSVLQNAPFTTLVHGDAKLANFCFTPDGKNAAAVDFQYIGKGCAMKDVALFMSSAVEPQQCAEMEAWILDEYFAALRLALQTHQPHLSAEEVEAAWRPLFAIAWADFQRFVKGWSPEHWKINDYTERLKDRALEMLKAYP